MVMNGKAVDRDGQGLRMDIDKVFAARIVPEKTRLRTLIKHVKDKSETHLKNLSIMSALIFLGPLPCSLTTSSVSVQ